MGQSGLNNMRNLKKWSLIPEHFGTIISWQRKYNIVDKMLLSALGRNTVAAKHIYGQKTIYLWNCILLANGNKFGEQVTWH